MKLLQGNPLRTRSYSTLSYPLNHTMNSSTSLRPKLPRNTSWVSTTFAICKRYLPLRQTPRICLPPIHDGRPHPSETTRLDGRFQGRSNGQDQSPSSSTVPSKQEKQSCPDLLDPMHISTIYSTSTDWEEIANTLFSTTSLEEFDPFHLSAGWEAKPSSTLQTNTVKSEASIGKNLPYSSAMMTHSLIDT